MFVKAIKKAKDAMFPIFRFDQLSPDKINIVVVGTGFFINSDGYIITVAHIFDGANSNTEFKYFGNLPENVINPSLNIQEIAKYNENDIFIGKIDIKSPGYFCLDKNMPKIGRSVCVCGYPLARIQNNPQGGLELGGVRRYFQPSFILDLANINADNGQGIIRKHDGFLIRDVGLFGMSGGPVFNAKGTVVGMQGSVTDPRESVNESGRTISVENAVAIHSNLILSFLRKQKIKVCRKYISTIWQK